MRLSSIKLSGFKSFVDPTKVNLPGDLIGVVGPNGCGKSNIIDAVRWVMGESSAKILRGESMDAVIFTGSSSRKPVGAASVELNFDNSDGTLGGEYARFAELAIRREVTRDGQSKYFLNNTRCRRRDIRDIFLGTGLGPRSYSIIEQGMISRLVEAKPEEMRVYLEEAAGISKYKERRRETENRIRHTRDNLDRLDDLREEVDAQIAKLKRQANTAERYRVLKDEETQVRGELLGLRWLELERKQRGSDESIRLKEVALEEQVAELRNTEAAIERDRENQASSSALFNKAQADYYKLGSDVSRIEQQINHTRESREQQSTELAQLEQSLREGRDHIEQDKLRIAEIDSGMQDDRPAYEQLQLDQKHSAEMLVQAEQQLSDWQARWSEHAKRESGLTQTAQIELSRMDQLERGISQSAARMERLQLEADATGLESLQIDIEQWIAEEVGISEEETRLQNRLASSATDLQKVREAHQNVQNELNSMRSSQQGAIGKLASLEALQQAALGGSGESAAQWLSDLRLVDKPRLAATVKVENGWEAAVEVVLGDYLEAVCVDDFNQLQAALDDGSAASAKTGKLMFVDTADGGSNAPAALPKLALLSSKVTSGVNLENLVGEVYVAEHVADALAVRQQLRAGQSVVTRDGLWLGPNWLRTGQHDSEGSVLEREKQIKGLQAELNELDKKIEVAQQRLENLNTKLSDHESKRESVQASVNQVMRQLADVKSNLVAGQQKLEQSHKRVARVKEEIAEVDQIRENDQALLIEARDVRAEALEALEALSADTERLRNEQQTLQANHSKAQSMVEQERSAGQELAIRMESMRTAREATEQNLQRMRTQIEQFAVRQEQLTLALSADEEDPLIELEASLDGILGAHLASEKSLAAAREELDKTESRLRSHEQMRVKHENVCTSSREVIQNEKMESQEVRVRLKTLEEQLQEGGYDFAEVKASLPDNVTVEEWAKKLEGLESKIQRLGPINLAAIEEHDEQLQRKEYLDSQHGDVIDALKTLEDAIAKIDKETRARFKETFDSVSNKMSEIFPRLFGGGQARLELTGDDLLSTGVAVLAQPPGKKITNNQLLSGGEKALTAVALVFAFFELNPSPFCMLDEVDAPLDDANVGRFCELVKEMSERVQFIFITHNKITMELANQLMGVTMNEPGVSRLVAVDIDEAAELAGV